MDGRVRSYIKTDRLVSPRVTTPTGDPTSPFPLFSQAKYVPRICIEGTVTVCAGKMNNSDTLLSQIWRGCRGGCPSPCRLERPSDRIPGSVK